MVNRSRSGELHLEPNEAVLGGFSRGPSLVATVFKVVAVLSLVAGSLSTLVLGLELARETTHQVGNIVGICLGAEGGTILVSAALAFFGYVLDLLVDIRDNTFVTADLALWPDEEESVTDAQTS